MTALRFLVVALLLAAATGAGNFVAARDLVTAACPPCLAWLVGGPFVVALVLGLLAARITPAPAPEATPSPRPTASLEEGALRLLGLLQEEGRLVDFLEEDVSAYDDAQVGAAARGIHEGCRKALRERVTLEPVLGRAEGETVVVEPGFDPAAIRLVGNLGGGPPLRGVLRHAGWRAKTVTVPARQGQDARVIAPAEVEVG